MSSHLTMPAQHAIAVAPSDTEDLQQPSRALWVGETGDVSVLMQSGAEITIANAQGLLPICVTRVFATGTTATGIVALI